MKILGQMLENTDLQNDTELPLEIIRQGLVVILCAILFIMFAIAIKRLFVTHRSFSFDCIILTIEALKILLFLLYEFFVVHLVILLIVVMIQTSIRAAVCISFFKKGLVIMNKKKWIIPLYVIYIGLIGSVIILTLIFALIPGRNIDCIDKIFSYHWYVIDSIDFLQSVLILSSSYFLVQHIKNRIRQEQIALNNLTNEMKSMHCLLQQTKFLAIFYMGFSIIDFLMMGLGNTLFKEDQDFLCINESTVVANNNGGAAFLLGYSILLIAYSLMLWFIFYKFPSNHGLVAKRSDQLRLNSRGESITQEIIVEQFIQMRKDEMLAQSPPSHQKQRLSPQSSNLIDSTTIDSNEIEAINSSIRSNKSNTSPNKSYKSSVRNVFRNSQAQRSMAKDY